MRKLLFFFTFIFFTIHGFADVGVFRKNGSTPQMEKSADIKVVKAEMSMILIHGNYPVYFSSRNPDSKIKHQNKEFRR